MGLRYFYTTVRRQGRRSLIHKGWTTCCHRPCAPHWHSTRGIPQPCLPMHRGAKRRVLAAMSPVQRAGGASPAHWWSAVDVTKTYVCGTCRQGASLFCLFLLLILIHSVGWWVVSRCTSFAVTPRLCAASK